MNCEEINKIFGFDELKFINILVTEPELVEKKLQKDTMVGSRINTLISQHNIDVAREEDGHGVVNEGQGRALVTQSLYYECKQNRDPVHLMCFIMNGVAENQIFIDGNKRTSFLAGVMFLTYFRMKTGRIGNSSKIDLTDDLIKILQKIGENEGNNIDGVSKLEKYFSDKQIS